MAAFVQLSSSFVPTQRNNLHSQTRALQLGHKPKRLSRKVRRVRLPVCTTEERKTAAFAAPTASSFTLAVGQSRKAKVVDAVKDAVARASSTLERQGVQANLAIVFVKSRGELTPDDEVRRVLSTLKTTLAMRRALSSDIVVFGCTMGNYVNDENDATINVTLASFPEGTNVRPFELSDKSSFDIDWKQNQWHDFIGVSPSAPASSSTSSSTPKDKIEPEANIQLFMLQHPDFEGMLDLLSGLDFAYPGVRKFGAMAGRAHPLDTIYLFGASGLVTKGVVGLAFSSPDVQVDVSVAQGARGVGPMMEVTEVRDGNEISKVKEIGTPSLAEAAPMVLLDMWASTDLISQEDRKHAREYLLLGIEVQKVTDLAFSSLTSAAKQPAGKKAEQAKKDEAVDMVVRKVVGFNDGTRSFAVEGGDVRLGSRVQFQVRDEDAARSELVSLFNKLMLEGASKAMEGMSLTGAIMLVDSERGEYLYGKLKADSDRGMYLERFPVPLVMLASEGQIGPLPAGGLLGTAGNTFTLSASALYVSFYSRNGELKQGEQSQPES